MQRDKRKFLGMIAAAAVALPLAATAQDSYPTRPVKILVGFPSGSSTDVAARAVAQSLSQSLGQQFLVENRPGATSNIAARAVATSAPDGYTLFVGTVANTISINLQPSVSVDVSKELVPVAMVGSVPNLLVVHPSVGVTTMQQLIDKAKAEPGRITYASSGTGTAPHLSGELLSGMAGIKLLHVPYKGSSQAVTDLLAGQVGMMFGPASTVLPHIRAGTLKALAATGLTRAVSMPELPTVDELGLKGFETSVWFGLNAPVGTPPEVIERLRSAVHAAQASPELQGQFAAQGIDMVRAGPKEYAERIRSETEKWGRVVRNAGLKIN